MNSTYGALIYKNGLAHPPTLRNGGCAGLSTLRIRSCMNFTTVSEGECRIFHGSFPEGATDTLYYPSILHNVMTDSLHSSVARQFQYGKDEQVFCGHLIFSSITTNRRKPVPRRGHCPIHVIAHILLACIGRRVVIPVFTCSGFHCSMQRMT